MIASDRRVLRSLGFLKPTRTGKATENEFPDLVQPAPAALDGAAPAPQLANGTAPVSGGVA